MREFAILQDLIKQARAYDFSGVHGHRRHTTIGVSKTMVTALHADDVKFRFA